MLYYAPPHILIQLLLIFKVMFLFVVLRGLLACIFSADDVYYLVS